MPGRPRALRPSASVLAHAPAPSPARTSWPAGRPVARSASRAACSRTAAAAASTTWRRARESLPPRRSASCASVVVNRSSTSRTGTGARRPARSAAKSLAPAAAAPSRPDSDVGSPTTTSIAPSLAASLASSARACAAFAPGTRRQHRQRGGQNAARVAASDSDPDRTHVHWRAAPPSEWRLPERKLTHREGPGAGPGWDATRNRGPRKVAGACQYVTYRTRLCPAMSRKASRTASNASSITPGSLSGAPPPWATSGFPPPFPPRALRRRTDQGTCRQAERGPPR